MERKEKGYLASEVEEKLGITATERKRWLNEGKIHYNGNQEYFHTRYGWKYVGLYDDEEIDKITTEQIEKWRDEHKKEISEKRKIAPNNPKITKITQIQPKKLSYLAKFSFIAEGRNANTAITIIEIISTILPII